MKFIGLDGKEYDTDKMQVTGWPGTPSPTIRHDEEIAGPEDTYLLFGWDDYNALGGTGDFQKTFSTIGEAQEWFSNNRIDNAEIVVFKRKRFIVVAKFSEEWDGNHWVKGWRRPR